MRSVFIYSQLSYPAMPQFVYRVKSIEINIYILLQILITSTTRIPEVSRSQTLRTKAPSLLYFRFPQKIGTVLSHDVLNPTRVNFQPANSRTLPSFYTRRLIRVDIEVPYNEINKYSPSLSACYPQRNFNPLSRPSILICAFGQYAPLTCLYDL